MLPVELATDDEEDEGGEREDEAVVRGREEVSEVFTTDDEVRRGEDEEEQGKMGNRELEFEGAPTPSTNKIFTKSNIIQLSHKLSFSCLLKIYNNKKRA